MQLKVQEKLVVYGAAALAAVLGVLWLRAFLFLEVRPHLAPAGVGLAIVSLLYAWRLASLKPVAVAALFPLFLAALVLSLWLQVASGIVDPLLTVVALGAVVGILVMGGLIKRHARASLKCNKARSA
jgi:hypothetical protein